MKLFYSFFDFLMEALSVLFALIMLLAVGTVIVNRQGLLPERGEE